MYAHSLLNFLSPDSDSNRSVSVGKVPSLQVQPCMSTCYGGVFDSRVDPLLYSTAPPLLVFNMCRSAS